MIQAQPDWQALTGDGLLKHPAESHAVDGHRLHAKADDLPGALIHHHQNPMRFEMDGLHPEQVQTPQTVRGLSQEREPGWTPAVRGSVMHCQYTPDDVLVKLDPKSVCQLLRDARTTKARVALFECDDRADQFDGWPLGTGLALAGPGI